MQGLFNWLPGDPSAEPLPAYSATPEALAPVHSRLCFADCTSLPEPPLEEGDPAPALPAESEDEDEDAALATEASSRSQRCLYDSGVHPHVEAHLRIAHPGLSAEDYRRRVLGDAVSQWPQPVPAQVLRSRLQAYTELLTDADFVQGVCACCARAKRRVKLRPALFPIREAVEPPAWLDV